MDLAEIHHPSGSPEACAVALLIHDMLHSGLEDSVTPLLHCGRDEQDGPGGAARDGLGRRSEQGGGDAGASARAGHDDRGAELVRRLDDRRRDVARALHGRGVAGPACGGQDRAGLTCLAGRPHAGGLVEPLGALADDLFGNGEHRDADDVARGLPNARDEGRSWAQQLGRRCHGTGGGGRAVGGEDGGRRVAGGRGVGRHEQQRPVCAVGQRPRLAPERAGARRRVLGRSGDDHADVELVSGGEDLLPRELVFRADLARHVNAPGIEHVCRGLCGCHGRHAGGVAEILARVVQRVHGRLEGSQRWGRQRGHHDGRAIGEHGHGDLGEACRRGRIGARAEQDGAAMLWVVGFVAHALTV